MEDQTSISTVHRWCRRPPARARHTVPGGSVLLGLLLLVIALPAEATRLTRLTYTNRDENWSSWEAAAGFVLFSSGETICGGGQWFCGPQNVWELRFEGDQILALNMVLRGAYHPRVSPDGQWMACMRHNGSDWDIWLYPVGRWTEGTRFQSLEGYQERFPNWSNDSQRLAFDSDRPSALGTVGYQVYWAPIAQAADPAAARQVTRLGGNNKHPTWNATDDEIAYVGDAQDGRSISAVRLDGTGYRLVTPDASQNRHPDWSPDGRWIAFVTDRWDGIGDVAIVDARGGGEVIRISEGMQGHDDFPEWSRDSRRILFCGTINEVPYTPNKEIYVAEDLPFDQAVVPVRRESVGAIKGGFSPR